MSSVHKAIYCFIRRSFRDSSSFYTRKSNLKRQQTWPVKVTQTCPLVVVTNAKSLTNNPNDRSMHFKILQNHLFRKKIS